MNDIYIKYKAIYVLPSLTLWEFNSMTRITLINNLFKDSTLLSFYTNDIKTNIHDFLHIVDSNLLRLIIKTGNVDGKHIQYFCDRTHNEFFKTEIIWIEK